MLGLVSTLVRSFQYCSSYSPPSESRPSLQCGHRALSTGDPADLFELSPSQPPSSECHPHQISSQLTRPWAFARALLRLKCSPSLLPPRPFTDSTEFRSSFIRHLLAWPRSGGHPVSVFHVPSDAGVFPSIYPASGLLTACLSAREDPPQAGLPEGWSSVLHSWSSAHTVPSEQLLKGWETLSLSGPKGRALGWRLSVMGTGQHLSVGTLPAVRGAWPRGPASAPRSLTLCNQRASECGGWRRRRPGLRRK